MVPWKIYQVVPTPRTLSNRYEQKLEDIKEWLSKTTWGQVQLSEKTLNEVQSRLHDLNLIEKIQDASEFLWK